MGEDKQRRRERTDEERATDDRLLEEWSRELGGELGLTGLEVDIRSILGLAGRAANGVARPAAPLTTFLAGYAAGLAVGAGGTTAADAMNDALATARRLAQSKLSDD